MFARNLFSNRHLLWVLLLAAMLLQVVGASNAAAQDGASESNTQAIVSVSNLDFVCTPPSPITQGIRLSGDFVIQAHIVTPPSPVLPPNPIFPVGTIVTLHLDATGISAVGLTDGTLYRGSQGTSQNFVQVSNTMLFDTAFDLIPSQSIQTSPNPVCPVQVSFQVQMYATEPGVVVISASLNTPD
jgi:hypothetical protein